MRIERLEINTRNFEEQKKFYSKILGIRTSQESGNSFELNVGSSIIKFVYNKDATPYHIAFHIPPEQTRHALPWLKQRVEIQKYDQDDIVDFSAWNAKSLYFYDADMNILEFISRKDLYPAGDEIFTEKSILAIAEIGMATKDIREKFDVLNQRCRLQKFDGNFRNFCAIGDDEGLIITIDKNKKDWFPTHDKAFASPFEMIFQQDNNRYKIIFEKDHLQISHSGF